MGKNIESKKKNKKNKNKNGNPKKFELEGYI